MTNPSTPGAGDREGGDGPSASLRGADAPKTWGECVREHFPKADDQLVDFILWGMTCYPFDTETTMRQLKELAEEVRPLESGWHDRLAAAAQKIDDLMSDAAGRNEAMKPRAET